MKYAFMLFKGLLLPLLLLKPDIPLKEICIFSYMFHFVTCLAFLSSSNLLFIPWVFLFQLSPFYNYPNFNFNYYSFLEPLILFLLFSSSFVNLVLIILNVLFLYFTYKNSKMWNICRFGSIYASHFFEWFIIFIIRYFIRALP